MSKLNIRDRNKNNPTKKPNWEYRFEVAKVGGKRKSISKCGFKTKKEALDAGTKALAEYNAVGSVFEPSEISVSDYFDYWLKNYCKVNLADSTLTSYTNIVNKYIKPNIGIYKLKFINSMVLQDMMNDIFVNKGLTKSFCNNILKVIKGGFKYAYTTAQLIANDPSDNVTLPKTTIKTEERKIIVLTKEQINKILHRFVESKHIYYAILTAFYTGLRVSEVYGLTWDQIDFENKTITINKIAKKIETEGKVSDIGVVRGIRGKASTRWYLGECKTNSSYRTIMIGDTLIQNLKEYKEWQESNKKLYGKYYTYNYTKDELTPTKRQVKRIISLCEMDFEIPLEKVDLVFVKENGEFSGTDSVKYASRVINNELGIEFNFHALRHTHATMLIEANVSTKAVAERLGHSNVRTTLETYVHVTDTMENTAVDVFETIGDLSTT